MSIEFLKKTKVSVSQCFLNTGDHLIYSLVLSYAGLIVAGEKSVHESWS